MVALSRIASYLYPIERRSNGPEPLIRTHVHLFTPFLTCSSPVYLILGNRCFPVRIAGTPCNQPLALSRTCSRRFSLPDLRTCSYSVPRGWLHQPE
jgi:hypothetical protein